MTNLTISQIIRQIVEKSLSPEEWTAFPNALLSYPDTDLEALRLLTRWEKLISLKTSNPSAFESRLQNLGLDREGALNRLKSRLLPANASLPSWGELLNEVLSFYNFNQPVVTIKQLQSWTEEEINIHELNLNTTPLFPEFLHPFISIVLQRINIKFPNLPELINNNTREQIARYLLLRLSTFVARVVAYEVKMWRFQGKLQGKTAEERYQYFVRQVLGTQEGLTELFLKYPVLARMLAVCSEQMVDVTVELLQNLQYDWEELESTFNSGACLGCVSSILMGLSDLHRGGRTVCILEFTSGLKLVYKPRGFEIDSAFNNLVNWLNQTQQSPQLRPTRILPRQNYGWSEYISLSDCNSNAEVAKFFRRQGAYAALIYFLCGSDFHYGNFIAAGEWPVPIDLEAILATGTHTRPQECKLPKYLHPAGQYSVLFSLMSCYWRTRSDNQILFSANGINGDGNRQLPILSKVWQELGTDGLKRTDQYSNFNFNNNLPQLDGKKIPVNQYIEEVVQGFAATYRTFVQHRDELLHPQGLLAAFHTVTTRVLLRDSTSYSDIISWSRAPDQLTSGIAYDVALEFLYTDIPVGNNLQLVEVLDEDKRCCWQQNIPIYYGCPSSVYIYSCHGTSYGPVVEKTSFEQMQQRFQHALEEDLIWQSELLRVSLQMSIYNDSRQQTLYPQLTTYNQPITDKQSVHRRLLDCAVEIGSCLVKLAMSHAHGNSWLSLNKISRTSTMVAPIHPDPWCSMGATGTSIFLANLARHTGDKRYEELARGALKFTAYMLQHFIDVELWDEIPISGYNGIGLFIYALTESGRCFQDEALIEQAFGYALKLTPERLRQEKNPDVLEGAAGALLSLLHLHQLYPDQRLIERSAALGESILKCQDKEGFQGWRVPHFDKPLLGIAHGAAGIAYALLRLYALTGQEKFRISAESGLAYERANFCHQAQDWPCLQQKSGKSHFMTGWCAGAPGIGMARLGILGICNNEPEVREEIDLAIAATQRNLGKYQHHLCCGEAGRIAFLSAAAQRLERPELLAVAASAGLKMIDFYEQVGYWRLQQFCERNIIPGLLDGVSGIGLTLLGLISPESTSQVMLLSSC